MLEGKIALHVYSCSETSRYIHAYADHYLSYWLYKHPRALRRKRPVFRSLPSHFRFLREHEGKRDAPRREILNLQRNTFCLEYLRIPVSSTIRINATIYLITRR